MKGKIACLVRGGEAGRKVQERAIAYAIENDITIVFIHVVDVSPVNGNGEDIITAMREELSWLGKVILNMARRRAKLAGIKTEGVVLYGTVLEAAQSYLSTHPTNLVLIGSPHPETPNYPQRLEKVHQFAGQLGEFVGVPVEVVVD